MIELSVIRDLVAIFGVIAGFSYYVLSVSNNQRNQVLTLKAQQQLETRQAQLFMQIYDKSTQKEFMQDFIDVIADWEWVNAEDFEKKYGKDVKFQIVSDYFEGIGVLVKRKLIDPEMVDDLMSGWIISFWEKTGSLTLEQRRRYNYPQANEHVEFLYNEIKRVAQSQHSEYADKERLSHMSLIWSTRHNSVQE